MSELVKSEHEGLNWEASIEALHHGSERRAWLIASFSSACAVLALTAIILLLPLKQVIPYLVSVDKATGQNEIVSLAASQPVGQRMIEAKYWIGHYVRSREEFDLSWLTTDFETTERLSGKTEARIYAAQIKTRLDEQKQGKVRTPMQIEILSIGLVDDSHAVVRFERHVLTPSTDQAAIRATANLVFTIKPPILGKEKDLIENPIGFEVQSYRVDQDLIETGVR